MSVFNKLIAMFTSKAETMTEFERIIAGTYDEVARHGNYFWNIKINGISFYQNEVVNWENRKKIDFIIYLLKEINDYEKRNNPWSTTEYPGQKNAIRKEYIQHLFKANLLMDDSDVATIYALFLENNRANKSLITSWPIAFMLNQIANQYQCQSISPLLQDTLLKMKSHIKGIDVSSYEKEKIKLLEKIDTIIFNSENDGTQVKPNSTTIEASFS